MATAGEPTGAGADRGRDLPALSIRRAWLVTVMNLLIVLAGVVALRGLEVRELPDVDYPVVAVRADYPGAAPETLDAEATRILEGAAARVPGVDAVRSASEEGNLRVIIEFQPGVDLVDAANDVRDAVSRITNDLPDGIENLVIVKADADAEPVMQLAVASDSLAIDELTRAIEEQLEPELVSVPGVADVTVFGARKRVMRVRLDPARMAAFGLDVEDAAAALRSARADVPAGSLESGELRVLVRADASITDPTEAAALQLRPGVRLGDVADVFFAPADASSYVRLDGRTVVNLGIVRQAQANTVEIAEGVRQVVARLRDQGSRFRVTIVSDNAVFIESAIAEIVTTLLITATVVVLVVGLFLGRWRATLVPAVAIPVSLIGTLGGIWLFGFSINVLTLLALVLASGLVVDDTIVVIENIQRRRAEGLGPRAAAVLGTREVFFAIMATTATLIAVFLPLSFMPSFTGRLFNEFGIVMSLAVALSSFVALTLGPMIAARLPRDREPNAVQRRLVSLGGHVDRGYRRVLGGALANGWLVLAGCLALALAAGFLFTQIPQRLTPQEDRGVLQVRLSGPDGVGLAYTDRQIDQVLIAMRPLLDEGVVTNLATITGRYDLFRGEVTAPMVPWENRNISQQQAAARIMRTLDGLPGARVTVRAPGSLSGRGGGGGEIRMAITGDDHWRIAQAAEVFATAIERELPGVSDVVVQWQATQPQLGLTIDRRRAAELGVPVDRLEIALRAMVEGARVGDLTVGDRSVPVMLESSRRRATDPDDLLMVGVRNDGGTLVPMAQFVHFEETAIPSELERFGQRRAVEMEATFADDTPIGETVDRLRELGARTLPPGMGLLFRGDAATFEENARDIRITFALALLVVFLVLVAQFESLTSAAAVLLTVPFGLAAAVFAMTLAGVSLTIYSQIGLLLLVGVMAKNSILMVEFADQLRDRGRSVRDAALEAAATRMRPILMTLSSTALGGLPLVLASGAGAEARLAIGVVIFGGLLLAVGFTLLLTPVLYAMLARFSKPRSRHAELLAQELADARGGTR
ncbi:MAG: efflux RND transporter permease subunit [Burkholderiaceae bacterium]